MSPHHSPVNKAKKGRLWHQTKEWWQHMSPMWNKCIRLPKHVLFSLFTFAICILFTLEFSTTSWLYSIHWKPHPLALSRSSRTELTWHHGQVETQKGYLRKRKTHSTQLLIHITISYTLIRSINVWKIRSIIIIKNCMDMKWYEVTCVRI